MTFPYAHNSAFGIWLQGNSQALCAYTAQNFHFKRAEVWNLWMDRKITWGVGNLKPREVERWYLCTAFGKSNQSHIITFSFQQHLLLTPMPTRTSLCYWAWKNTLTLWSPLLEGTPMQPAPQAPSRGDRNHIRGLVSSTLSLETDPALLSSLRHAELLPDPSWYFSWWTNRRTYSFHWVAVLATSLREHHPCPGHAGNRATLPSITQAKDK